MEKRVYTVRDVEGNCLFENKNLTKSMNYFEKNQSAAYIELEDIDSENGECFYSKVLKQRDFFSLLRMKFSVEDFSGHLGVVFDDNAEDEDSAAAMDFLYEIYDMASEYLNSDSDELKED